jgi:alkanesulfonate monooxygenase SsuD/methylene tetrahydromethanopterin reductase-like flavin-dependent oxidoreductase (luciferase family)
MTATFRLGFMTHNEGPADPRRIYAETLALFVTAEQLGFEVAWVAQHHFKPRAGRLPSPFPFLAAASQRTRRMRLGTAVVILPLEDPLRVAEDAAVVDALSAGRLELGVGTGGDPDEFATFGRGLDTRHAQSAAGIDLLQRAFRGEELGSRQQHLEPPAPTLADRLWQGVMSEASAKNVAARGLGLMLARSALGGKGATDELQLPMVEAYSQAWHAAGTPCRIGLSRSVYPATDRATALAALRADVLRNVENLVVQGQLPAGLSLEEYCARLNILYGHPDDIVAALRADRILPFATDLILQFSPAVPPLGEAMAMLELIATGVAPQLGWKARAPES